jgi:hypothetical protein
MVDNGVAMTSTLAVYELSFPDRPPLEDRVLEALAPEATRGVPGHPRGDRRAAASRTMPEVFRKAQAFEKAFVRRAACSRAGVDPTGHGGALPGFGDQRNYELLLEAGFTRSRRSAS